MHWGLVTPEIWRRVPASDRTVAIERHDIVDYIAILSFFVLHTFKKIGQVHVKVCM